MTEHTPTPWHVDPKAEEGNFDYIHILNHRGSVVVVAINHETIVPPEPLANARLIVEAVNSYASSLQEIAEKDARIERLEAALREIADITARCEHDGGFDREIGPIGCMLGDKCVCIGIHPAARSALSNTEAGQ